MPGTIGSLCRILFRKILPKNEDMLQLLKNKYQTGLWVITVIVCLLVTGLPAEAQSAKSLFYQAENAYKKLRHDAKKQKYRSYWMNCINQFKAVYDKDPDGPWAAAGLFMTGTLYRELYQHSFDRRDKNAAAGLFQQVVRDFPKSRYHKRSDTMLAKMGISGPSVTAGNSTRTPAAEKAEAMAKKQFNDAQSCYQSLLKSPSRRKYRGQWLTCIKKFQTVVDLDPTGPWAAAGLYMRGLLYEGLSGYSFNNNDKQKAVVAYDRIVADFPNSRYRKKADRQRYALTGSHYTPPAIWADDPVPVIAAPKVVPPPELAAADNATQESGGKLRNNGRTTITGVRYWSNPNYTRVVIDAAGGVAFNTPHLLDENPAMNKPQRLYFDVHQAWLDPRVRKYVAIDDNLLSAVRAAQNTKETVRVVIDIKSYKTYKIFPLLEPSRIVVDVWGTDAPATDVAAASPPQPEGGNTKMSPGALAKQLALGVRTIVIDPGHGGKDPGAVGYMKNVYEKNITLDLARQLGEKIKSELGCEVVLTRTSDRSISLEERTALANTRNADLFISIHVNAHRNRSAHGLETYFLNLATDDESIRVAARENATSEKNISDLHTILTDLMQNAKINESSRLATFVQGAMYDHMKSRYRHIKDNGVKKAPFYVLLGAQMPAILVETSFISNERECRRLTNKNYQTHLCDAIVKGVRDYIRETSPNTLSRK